MTATTALPLPGAPAAAEPSPVQGTLALEFPLPSGLPAVPRTPALTLVVGGVDAVEQEVTAGQAVPRQAVPGQAAPAPAAPPTPRAWAGRFVQAVVEVIAGDRPLQQLVRWTDERVYADLSRRVRLLGLTTSAASRHRMERSSVRSVHLFQPRPDAVEVAAHVRHGRRSRAVAARLELEHGRWTCTALRLG